MDSESAKQNEDSGCIKAVIYGMTCDGTDIIASNVTVPKNIEVDDWFCFGGMGAYTHSLIS